MTREEAIAQLQAAGAVLDQGGDVRALKEAIIRPAINRKPLIFNSGNQCNRKKRYDTEDDAHRAAKRGGNPEVRPYRCVYCKAWHNGNPPKSRNKRWR